MERHGLASYLIGFVLAVILTAIPFWLVYTHALPPSRIMWIIAGAAVLQILVHLHFFLHINFTTIASNTTPVAGRAGGIQLDHNFQVVYLRTSILAHNTAAGVPANCAKVAPATGVFEPVEHRYNLESANTCGLDAAAPSNDLIGVDPLLAPLAANGGPTRTRGLYDGSPARSRVPVIGDVDYCLPSGGFDQRGVARVVLGEIPPLCDVGAFEGSVGPVPTPFTPATKPVQPKFNLKAAIAKCKKKFKGKKKAKQRKKCIRKARRKAASG